MGESYDSESLLSLEAGNSNRNQKPRSKKKDLSFKIRTIEHATIRCRAVAPHVGPYELVISGYDTKQDD